MNPQTGDQETVIKEGETDVLVVLEDFAKRRVAIHIENKLASGHFTSFQPELYAARAACWKGNPKYCGYEDWETVLVAPQAFYDRWKTEAAKFDRFVPHEEIALHVPLFAIQV